jgi:hypothetical protein
MTEAREEGDFISRSLPEDLRYKEEIYNGMWRECEGMIHSLSTRGMP